MNTKYTDEKGVFYILSYLLCLPFVFAPMVLYVCMFVSTDAFDAELFSFKTVFFTYLWSIVLALLPWGLRALSLHFGWFPVCSKSALKGILLTILQLSVTANCLFLGVSLLFIDDPYFPLMMAGNLIPLGLLWATYELYKRYGK